MVSNPFWKNKFRANNKKHKKFFNTSPEKNILYFGPEAIIKKIIENNYNFNSFYVSSSASGDLAADLQKLPFKDSSIDNIILIHSLDIDNNPAWCI